MTTKKMAANSRLITVGSKIDELVMRDTFNLLRRKVSKSVVNMASEAITDTVYLTVYGEVNDNIYMHMMLKECSNQLTP